VHTDIAAARCLATISRSPLVYLHSADGTNCYREEEDEQKAKGGALITGGLGVDLGEGKRAIATGDGAEIGDAIHNCYAVAEGRDEAQPDLGKHRFRKVYFWVGKLFGHVSDGIRGSNRKRTIEYAREESDAAAPASAIDEVTPDEGSRGVVSRHGSDDDDRYQSTDNDKEEAAVLEVGNQAIAEDDECGAEPGDENECHVGLPGLDDKVGVEDCVHLHRNIGGNGSN